jgi:UDP-N-acetylglucosamine:LPS N-acetylglucosamine transferase
VIFEEILQNLETILEKHEVILVLGKLNTDMRIAFDEKIKTIPPSHHPIIQLIDWISQSDLAHLLSDTDIAITRGSATTLAEIDVFGVKKIIIPLPHSAENHQYYNALEYEKK